MTTAIQTTARTQTTSQRRRGLRCSMDSGLPYRKRIPRRSYPIRRKWPARASRPFIRVAFESETEMKSKSGARLQRDGSRLRDYAVAGLVHRSHLPGHGDRQSQLIARDGID